MNFRKGMVINYEGEYYMVLDFQHVMLGRGSAYVRVKLRNVKTGKVLEKNIRESDTFEEVKLFKKPAIFSYSEGDIYHFYDKESYEEISFEKDVLGDALYYLKENLEVNLLYIEETPIGIELPNFVELKVIETEPGVRGDTVSGGSKPAKLETGKIIQVPLFINVGDVIKIDTRTGEYIERV
ncbi:MAG: elongation factor P [candidate division WOR-3 bacterium]